MKEEFGNNFVVTEKKLPEDFFDTMLKSLTSTIEATRLMSLSTEDFESDDVSPLEIQ